MRGPEPQPVALERTADREAAVVDLQDAVARRDVLRSQLVVDVPALQAVVGEIGERRAAEAVAAFLGNDVDAHPAARDFRGDRADLVAEFLRRGVVGRDPGARIVARHVGVHQAVELHQAIVERSAVGLQLVLVLARRSADVVLIAADAHRHDADGRPVLRRRHRRDRLLADHLPLDDVLHVDHWRRGAHDDRFLDRADFQVGTDGRRELRRKLDAFALHRGKTGQRERHRIYARP
jgi:hypothetical protein